MLKNIFVSQTHANIIPLTLLSADNFDNYLNNEKPYLNPQTSFILCVNDDKTIDQVIVKLSVNEPMFSLANLFYDLPEGTYALENDEDEIDLTLYYQLMVGFGLGAYQYDVFKEKPQKNIQIVLPNDFPKSRLINEIEAHYLVRDLINHPPNLLTPDFFSEIITSMIDDEETISMTEIKGDQLLEENFPLIHHVGRGSEFEPRLIEINYAPDNAVSTVTLVGKGVTFDTGGLDIKPSSGMRLMKKDMGGAAHALALGLWLIREKAPINLRILLPIVENSVSAKSMRPGDIIFARNGLSVEIDNTDAEGRLILADALSYASEKPSDLIIDFATLTGAARVALGPEIPVFFTHNDYLASKLKSFSLEQNDFVWQLPLHAPYKDWIKSEFADILNSATQPYAGAITAALFLQSFVKNPQSYVHFDIMAYNIRKRKGRPIGGEAMSLRTLMYTLLDTLSYENDY